eukprot:TRINITY_DN2890_c4_g1::TRINITY_DN2890_c4_g1_i1::g.5838::m.5838 TRINITY_DN2890_c4_g1::TRINITY_DN2890_c4_g1_i1::g.5838  ORF type:complete len:523 (-),score=117.40,sp/O18824/SCRB1_BOVIN/24.24/6e-35,CD36/PF01130.16/5.3e-74,Neurensin/PF14927.1/0.062,Neurensin/PF14927.1/7e+03 TRINITY_DN2890_c4_g1_i1:73-1641(-)
MKEQQKIKLLKISGFVLTGLGLVVLICGLVFSWYIDSSLKEEVKQSAIVDGFDDDDYDVWVKNHGDKDQHADEYMNFYFWNITNLDDILQGRDIPRLEELGPYRYRQYLDKFDVEFTEKNAFVSYKMFQRWHFLPELSVTKDGRQLNDVTDMITTVNCAYSGAVALLQNEAFLNGLRVTHLSALFHSRSVHEHIWGFEDAMLGQLQQWLPDLVRTNRSEAYHNCTDVEDCRNYWRGPTTMVTGTEDYDNVHELRQWDGMPTSYYYPNNCSIAGSDKKQLRPDVTVDYIRTFEDRLMRPFYLKYKEDFDLKGVTLRRYTPDYQRMYSNPNVGFAMHALMDGEIQDGIIDISLIYRDLFGSPVPLYISQPHFYNPDIDGCEPPFCDKVAGMAPNFDDHCTMAGIEPITGKTMWGRRRAQVNLLINATHFQEQECESECDPYRYSNVSTAYMPFFWFEETGQLTDDSADYFKSNVYFYSDLSNGLFIASLVVGCTSLVAGPLVLIYYRKKLTVSSERVDEPLLGA